MINLGTLFFIGLGCVVLAIVFWVGGTEEETEEIKKYKATQFSERTWKAKDNYDKVSKAKSELGALDFVKASNLVDEKDYQKGLKEINNKLKGVK